MTAQQRPANVVSFPMSPRHKARTAVHRRVAYLTEAIEYGLSGGTLEFFRAVVDENDPYFSREGGRASAAGEASDKAWQLARLFDEISLKARHPTGDVPTHTDEEWADAGLAPPGEEDDDGLTPEQRTEVGAWVDRPYPENDGVPFKRKQRREVPNGQTAGPEHIDVQITRGDMLTPVPVDWLWENWLVRGKFNLTAGRPETLKTTLELATAFGAVPRLVLFTAECHNNDAANKFVVCHAKNSIGVKGGGFGYDFDVAELYDYPGVRGTRILWGEHIDGNPYDIIEEAERRDEPAAGKESEAKAFIRAELKNGAVMAKAMFAKAELQEITEITLKRAKKSLGVRTSQAHEIWWWSLS